MLLGRPPFMHENMNELMKMIKNGIEFLIIETSCYG